MGRNQGKDGYESDDAGRDRQYRFAFGSGNHGFSRSADAPQPGTSAGGLGQDAEQSRRRVVYERPSEWQHRNSLAGSADFQIRSIDLAPSSHANGMGACQPQPGTRNPCYRGDQTVSGKRCPGLGSVRKGARDEALGGDENLAAPI